MTGSARHGWAVFSAMAFLFLAGVFSSISLRLEEIRNSQGSKQEPLT